MNPASSIPWRSSLVTRLVLLWSLLLGGLVLLCGWLIWKGGRDSLVRTWRENLRHDAAAVQLKLRSAVTTVMRDVAFLSKTPTLREFVRAAGTPEAARWQALVEDEFHALLEGKPSYFQVRLIGMADGGREVIRLDHTAGKIEIVAERLQQKGDRDYVRESIRLPGIYVSAMNLNQEYGRVTEPHIPTLRAALRLHSGTEIFGVLVINVDVSTLLAELAYLPGDGIQLVLAGHNPAVPAGRGSYLIHPDETLRFGADLGLPARFAADFPAVWQAGPGEAVWGDEAEGDLVHGLRFQMAPDVPQEMAMALVVPAESWLKELKAARDRAALATGVAALVSIAVIVLLSRWLAGRLHRVTGAMAAWEAGKESPGLPAGGDDELGRLAATFGHMAEKVRDHVTRLDAARREAEEATRLKEEFLAVMSHEIRTPMNSVTGLIRVLERNQPARHQEPVIRSLRTAARNLMALLNDALDYTKLKAGGLDFERQTFSLRRHLDDLALTHRPLAMQKGLEFDLDLDPALPETVEGDPVRLMQILNNLVSNALKFTDHGHVSVTARPLPGGQVAFAVADTGVGIPEAEQARIFAPFTQVRRPDGRQFDGSGLGLSIARELVERQGGALSVSSTPGEGTCFTVTLPLRSSVSGCSEAAAALSGTAPDLSGLRLLCVEDVASNRHVMSAIIGETGAALTFAGTGAEAISALEAAAFDAVLLDLQLPDATGAEIARRISPRWPDLPVIAVTAQAGTAVRAECEAAGMRAVVLKPIEPDQLFAAIRGHALPPAPPAPFPATESGEEPCLEGLAAIFGSRPEKFREVLASVSEEFAGHAASLKAALRDGDAAAVRALRHRMHTAVVQLKLGRLSAMLDALLPAGGGIHPDPARHRQCLDSIAAVSRFLRRSPAETP